MVDSDNVVVTTETTNDSAYVELKSKYDRLLAATEKQVFGLNEELDLLSEENQRLRAENFRLRKKYESTSSIDSTSVVVPEELLLPPSESNRSSIESLQLDYCFETPHEAGNLLSCDMTTTNCHTTVVASGGVDKNIVLHDVNSHKLLAKTSLGAPVLSIVFHPKEITKQVVIAAATMDGKVHVLSYNEELQQLSIVQTINDHNKVGATSVKFSLCGHFLATASSDKSVHLYKSSKSAIEFVKVQSYYFNGPVEVMAFLKQSLVIAARSDCYLHFVSLSSFEKTRLNLNVDGIEHCSYNIMDLVPSPNSQKYLLVATDANRHFIIESDCKNTVLRDFYGHDADCYSKPRVVWHPSESYFFSNSQSTGDIYIYAVASCSIVKTLSGHTATVRDLTLEGSEGSLTLASVSYDKTLRIWKCVSK